VRAVLRIPQVAALLAVGLLAASPAGAEVRRVAFAVDGMICPLCTRGVEEAIRQLPGVARVTADLATGEVQVEAADRQSLDIQQVRDRAARAGFPVNGGTEVEARGRFDLSPEGRITFRPTGTTYVWQVIETTALKTLFHANRVLKGDYIITLRLHGNAALNRAAISVSTGRPATAPAPAAPATTRSGA
jgi:copper chaperone CopZ